MQAIVLGAGYGTRLRPVTDHIPKIMLPVLDRPLLANTIYYLKHHGVTRIALNTHHMARSVEDFLADRRRFGIEILVHHEPSILGTGGGVGGLGGYVSEDNFVIYNGDIVTNINLSEAFDFHLTRKPLVTMILHDYPKFNKVAVDRHNRVTEIEGRSGKQQEGDRRLAFSAVAIAGRRLLDRLPRDQFCDMKEIYRALLSDGSDEIAGFIARRHYWRDIGTAEDYLALHRDILVGREPVLVEYELPSGPVFVGRNALISDRARLGGFVSVGHDSRIEEARVSDSVVLSHTLIRAGEEHANCVIGPDWKVRAG